MFLFNCDDVNDIHCVVKETTQTITYYGVKDIFLTY